MLREITILTMHQPASLLSFVDLYLHHHEQIPGGPPWLMRLPYPRTSHHPIETQSE